MAWSLLRPSCASLPNCCSRFATNAPLSDRVRVQAATVGIELKGRSGAAGDYLSTVAARREEDAFLKQLSVGNRPSLICSTTNPG